MKAKTNVKAGWQEDPVYIEVNGNSSGAYND